MQIDYDSELNTLLIHKNKPAKHTIELGEILIDIDTYNRITAIEIINPDKLFKITKKKLRTLKDAKITTRYRDKIYWIFIKLIFENETTPISIPLTLSSPKLAATI